ncbi:TauD/TfdA dioxygenase family protein [Providencia manganoxydans]|uniref:TauD/TfdA dioxygenase family protein n=1 Tax=Providencia manganoxydans TaxID=2923283 RepID=UPI0032DB34BD
MLIILQVSVGVIILSELNHRVHLFSLSIFAYCLSVILIIYSMTLAPAIHNLVQVHPYTGQQSLFAISGTAFCFDEISQEVSLKLLNELEDFIIENSQFYQHHYSPNDIIIWDNLLTLHRGYAIKPSHDIQNSRLLYRMNVNYSNRGLLL